jgi:hypothetical protein
VTIGQPRAFQPIATSVRLSDLADPSMRAPDGGPDDDEN